MDYVWIKIIGDSKINVPMRSFTCFKREEIKLDFQRDVTDNEQ